VLRRLTRAPLFTAVTLITLAVGVGANTVIFSVVEGVLLKPMPYPHAGRLLIGAIPILKYAGGRVNSTFERVDVRSARAANGTARIARLLVSGAGYRTFALCTILVRMDREYTDRFLRTTSNAATKDTSAPETVLHAAFDAIVQGNFDAFGQSVTLDVELNITGFGALDGTWRGRDEVVAATRRNFALVAEQKPEIESMISEGDRIAVLLRESGVLKSTGQAYTVRGVQWFTFAEGKISKIDEIVASSPHSL
jgi:ketosteroid isomerase-like protein